MSYLARLRAHARDKLAGHEPSQPSKGPIEGSEGTQQAHIAPGGGSHLSGISKTVTGEDPQPTPKSFDFAPPSDPESDREAIDERAAIIAEGCGMNPLQALQEARWHVERERSWRVFLRNAKRILEASEAARIALLGRYTAEATSRYGKAVAEVMARTMREWVGARILARPVQPHAHAAGNRKTL